MVRTIELGMDGYTFLAFEVLQRDGIPMQRQLVGNLDKLIDLQHEARRLAASEAALAYIRTRGLMIGLGLLSAAIAALIASLVIRRTARLSAETERERTKFQTLFETNTDGIVILSEQGFSDCNGAALEMFGVESVARFIALQPEDLGTPTQHDGVPARDWAVGFIREAVEKGHSMFDWRGKRQDGSLFDAEIALHAMRLGERSYIQAIIRDVSPQKEAARALKAAHDAALAAADLKSQFVANVSHEIRTPLNGILGMTRFLQRSPLNAQQKEYAETIHFSAEALLGLINDLLDFSKIEAGRLHIEHIVFDLPRLLREVTGLNEARAEAKGLRLELDMEEDLEHWVVGDPLRLRQILLNLLDNAVKFTDAGGITLRASMRERNPEHCQLRLSVRDTGIGIPEAAFSRIFQAFAQADGSTSRKYGGTGLGLAISRQLAELMGGALSVDSIPGQGSEFHVDLPVIVSAHPPEETDTTAIIAPGLSGRVLVAEDNPVNQKVTRYMIESMGVEVVLAGDGKAAFDYLADNRVDLVLMDCQMPEWDGFMATRAIREREQATKAARLPIVALTANAMAGYDETCRAAGMDDYLAKPLREEELLRVLNRWLSRAPMTEPEPTTPTPESTKAPENPGFDLDKLRKLCRDDRAQVNEMLTVFIDSTGPLLKALGDDLARGDAKQAARQAHQIKGAAAYLDAPELTRLATEAEAAAKSTDLERAAKVLPALQEAFDSLSVRMKSLM
jgi:PAS domain S-box-containing protein